MPRPTNALLSKGPPRRTNALAQDGGVFANELSKYLDPRYMAGRGLPNQASDPRMMTTAASFAPVVGDAIGLLADAGRYVDDPQSLTPVAGLLSLAGLIPGIPSIPKSKLDELERLGFDTVRPWFHSTDNLADWQGKGFKRGSGWFADSPDAASAFHPSGAVVPVFLKKKIKNADGTYSVVPRKKEWAETVLVDDPEDIFMILPGR